MVTLKVWLTLLGLPLAEAYVAPRVANAATSQPATAVPELFQEDTEAKEENGIGTLTASFGAGAVLGLLSRRRSLASLVAGVTAAPLQASATNGMDGEMKPVDINNAQPMEFRQFPGMYPSAASLIVANTPYEKVSDIYSIRGVDNITKAIFKKYEQYFECGEQQANPGRILYKGED